MTQTVPEPGVRGDCSFAAIALSSALNSTALLCPSQLKCLLVMLSAEIIGSPSGPAGFRWLLLWVKHTQMQKELHFLDTSEQARVVGLGKGRPSYCFFGYCIIIST